MYTVAGEQSKKKQHNFPYFLTQLVQIKCHNSDKRGWECKETKSLMMTSH